MDNEKTPKKTYFHQILGRIFKFLLAPLKISVFTDVKVMITSPEADILLLRREEEYWTDEQLERLPDGIRQSIARHILIEFKATESISKEAFTQASSYDYFYKQSQKLADDELQTFLISAIEPQKANREQYGYHIKVQPGVYQSDNIAFNHITLISLNELSDELHNSWITCLASKKMKRLKSFQMLQAQGFQFISAPFRWFLLELWQRISIQGDFDMALKLSSQDIKEIGQFWGSSAFTPEDFKNMLDTLPPQKRKDYFATFPPEERLADVKPEERLAGMTPTDVMNYFKQTNKLSPPDILGQFSPEEIEAYLKQRKQQKNG
jgi:hypothetical protein